MRLTFYTDYALRLLIYLAMAADEAGRRPTIAEIADFYGISRNHLTKVAHHLGRSGHILTVRGKGGGLRLGRPPEAIGLGELIRATEPDFALLPCFAPIGEFCRIQPACGLIAPIQEASQAFFDVLDRYTLADVIKAEARLRALFENPAPLPGKQRPRRGRREGAAGRAGSKTPAASSGPV
jgi:Rrf2 family nitric oxide-sensitive transcriptional repressor